MDKWTNATLNFTSTLSGDSDVSLNNLSNGQVLQFNGSKWTNITLNFTSTLSGDSDVSLNNLSIGQLLQYNSTLSKWNNISPTYISNCSINACTDATLSSLVTNNVLMYNGLKWINSTMSLEMNNDVNVSSLTNKNIIR